MQCTAVNIIILVRILISSPLIRCLCFYYSSISNISRGKDFAMKLIVDGLGQEKCNSLPGFHVFSGADITGAFYKKERKLVGKFTRKGGSRYINGLRTNGGGVLYRKNLVKAFVAVLIGRRKRPFRYVKQISEIIF